MHLPAAGPSQAEVDLAALRGASSLGELHIQGAYLAGLQALAGLSQLKVSTWPRHFCMKRHKASDLPVCHRSLPAC
jgi:hypothetical protein